MHGRKKPVDQSLLILPEPFHLFPERIKFRGTFHNGGESAAFPDSPQHGFLRRGGFPARHLQFNADKQALIATKNIRTSADQDTARDMKHAVLV